MTNLSTLAVGGVPVFGNLGGIPFTGNYWFVSPATGADGNDGSAALPLATLYEAHRRCIDGNNDVVILMGNGQSSGTARLSLALAQASNSAATSGVLNWTKNATHLIGVCAPSRSAQRARIAPPSGAYTQATFGSGNFVVVTGSGCLFANISLFHGFSTGGTNQICWTDNGARNAYQNVDFFGQADAASAADAGSRSVKIGLAGTGENAFYGCTFGGDTVARTAGAALELSGATPRNTFEDCLFPVDAGGAGVLSILGTGAGCVDRFNIFKRCGFPNAMSSGATAQTVIASFTNAAPGGLLVFADSWFIGDANTNWGDTNMLANSWINMPAPATATGGVSVKPS